MMPIIAPSRRGPGSLRALAPRLLPALASSAALIAVAACGTANSGSGTHGSAGNGGKSQAGSGQGPQQAILAAAQATKTVSSLTGTLTETVTGSTPVTINAAVRERRLPVLELSMNMTMGASGRTQTLDATLTSTDMYLKLAALAPALGKPWARIPLSRIKEGNSSLASILQSVSAADPLSAMRPLAHAKDIRKAGTGTVAGVATTEYTGSYPVSAMLATEPASLRSLITKTSKLITGPIQFQVWVDGQQHIRKVVTTEQVAGRQTVATFIVTSVNQPVTITAPPASQVATLPVGAGGL